MKNVEFRLTFILFLSVILSVTACNQSDLTHGYTQLDRNFDLDSNYIFEYPDWVLIEEDYEDEFGNIGTLFQNANNSIETKFIIERLADGQSVDWTGTFKKLFNDGVCIGETCVEPKLNCIYRIQRNADGEITGASITIKD